MNPRRVLVVAVTLVATLLVPAGAGAVAIDGPPAVVSLLPQVASPAGGTPIRVYGTGFEGTTAVTVGGVAAPDFAVIDSKLLTVVAPAGAVNSLATISLTDNQGTGSSDDDTNRLRYTAGSVSVSPDTGLVGGEAVSVSVTGHVPNASGVLLQLNPLAGLLENPPDWGVGPIPYAVPKGFPTLDASGSLTPTTVTLEAAFRGSQAGYDPNNLCPVTQDMADHGIGACQVVFSQLAVGSLEHDLSYATDPAPAPPTLAVAPAAAVGDTVTFSGLHWRASPYFGSDTAPDDPGETALAVEVCTPDQSACAPVAGDATVALTRYHDADATVPNVQPSFSGATLEGSFTVDNVPACAPTCLLRVGQEGYAYPAGGGTGTFITAAAPLVVTGEATTTTSSITSSSSSSTSTTTTTLRPSVPAVITTFAGNGRGGLDDSIRPSGDGGPATDAFVNDPSQLTRDGAGNLYIAEAGGARVRKVDPSGAITTVAGTGVLGYGGDGLGATQALLRNPRGVAIGPGGDLYIADTDNHRIRRVDRSGIITTVAGIGVAPPSDDLNQANLVGDGEPATQAFLNQPWSVALDTDGALYIADRNNHRIRKVEPGANGVVAGDEDDVISTVVGTGQFGFGGDGGPGPQARLNRPEGVAVDGNGGLLIADTSNGRVRRLDPDGVISTVAGTGQGGFGGDGGPATAAQLGAPSGAVGDGAGGILIADAGNHRTRRIDAGGTIATVAGSGSTNVSGFVGEGGPPTEAMLWDPSWVTVDTAGRIYIADSENDGVRVVTPNLLILTADDSPDPVAVGQALTYTASVRAPSGTSGAVLTDVLPTQVTFVSAVPSQGSCTRQGDAVECGLGTLPPGGSATVDITVFSPPEAAELVNRVSVASAEHDPYTFDNATFEKTSVSDGSVATPSGALLVVLDDRPDPGQVGQPLTYTATVSNGLPVAATGVVLSDSLPAELRFVSASATQGSCAAESGTVRCELGVIASGANAIVRIETTPMAGGEITSIATVTANESAGAATQTTHISGAGCGQVITADTTLDADVGPCIDHGIDIGADRVTLDLGGHRVYGFPGSVAGNSDDLGINMVNRRGVTVRNGAVSGFYAGVVMEGGGSNTLSGLEVRDNVGPDSTGSAWGDGILLIRSADNRIVGNTVVGNGHYDGIGVLGAGSDHNVIEDNLVEDSVGFGTDVVRGPSGQGIFVAGFFDFPDQGKLIYGNVIRNNTVRTNGSAGIGNLNHADGLIVGNTITGNGTTNAGGNGIGVNIGLGVPPGVKSNLEIRDNQVHDNAWNGIDLRHTARGNRVLNNDASNNNRGGVPITPSQQATEECIAMRGAGADNPQPAVECAVGENPTPTGFDLRDENFDENGQPSCVDNVWSGNTWGAGGFFPACTANEGRFFGEDLVTSTTSTSTTLPPPAAPAPPADFDGDGDTDVSVFRPSSGAWFVESGATTFWGAEGDVSVPADYDGDGNADTAVFRPSSGAWYVEGGPSRFWGTSGDLPVPADYDGDGDAEIAVFRPSSGAWFVDGGPTVFWGTDGDLPVPADYDGDGDAEIAVFRPSTGAWFVDGGPTVFWGTDGDVPVPADYDGDGDAEIAVFRPSSGAWFVDGGPTVFWGTTGDVPVSGDYGGDGDADIAVFRPSSGAWFVDGGPTVFWGTDGDQALPLPAGVREWFFGP